MTVKSVFTRRNNVTSLAPNLDNAPSTQIWDDFPEQAIIDGVDVQGITYVDQFTTLPKTPNTTEGNFGLYSQFAGATGTITADAGSSAWTFTSTASGDGVVIRSNSTPFRIDRSVGKLWFEARVKTSSIADGLSNVFLGLCETVASTAVVPIASTTATSNNNMVGFTKLGTAAGNGAQMQTYYKAANVAAVNVQAPAVTLAAATYTKLGMVFQPSIDPLIQDPNFLSLGKWNLTFYQDGVRLATYKNIPLSQGTDFPNSVYLSFVLAWMSRSASPDALAIDWVKIGQVFSPGWVF